MKPAPFEPARRIIANQPPPGVAYHGTIYQAPRARYQVSGASSLRVLSAVSRSSDGRSLVTFEG